MTRVIVFHNIARDEQGTMINYLGYLPGHPLVRVFEADVDLGNAISASALAELMWIACNVDPEHLTGPTAVLARAYRDRRLRSLSFPGKRTCCPRSYCVCRSSVLSGSPWTR